MGGYVEETGARMSAPFARRAGDDALRAASRKVRDAFNLITHRHLVVDGAVIIAMADALAALENSLGASEEPVAARDIRQRGLHRG